MRNLLPPSRYNAFHALALVVVLAAALGGSFWPAFIDGGPKNPPPPANLVLAVVLQVALFAVAGVGIRAATLFQRAPEGAAPEAGRLGAVKTALRFSPLICLCTFAVELAGNFVLEHGFGLKFPAQNIIAWLKPGIYPLWTRIFLMGVALFEAPLVEEPIFRGIMLRGFAKGMGFWPAALISGTVFALVHVNAATTLPLLFLGVAFAWLYARTGSILAPMTAHFVFNLLNLVLCLSGLVE